MSWHTKSMLSWNNELNMCNLWWSMIFAVFLRRACRHDATMPTFDYLHVYRQLLEFYVAIEYRERRSTIGRFCAPRLDRWAHALHIWHQLPLTALVALVLSHSSYFEIRVVAFIMTKCRDKSMDDAAFDSIHYISSTDRIEEDWYRPEPAPEQSMHLPSRIYLPESAFLYTVTTSCYFVWNASIRTIDCQAW